MHQSVESLKNLGIVLSQKSTVNESGKGLSAMDTVRLTRAGREAVTLHLRYVTPAAVCRMFSVSMS